MDGPNPWPTLPCTDQYFRRHECRRAIFAVAKFPVRKRTVDNIAVESVARSVRLTVNSRSGSREWIPRRTQRLLRPGVWAECHRDGASIRTTGHKKPALTIDVTSNSCGTNSSISVSSSSSSSSNRNRRRSTTTTTTTLLLLLLLLPVAAAAAARKKSQI